MAGYTKIVQYGDTTEIYTYDKEIKPKPPSKLKAWTLYNQKNKIQKNISNTRLPTLLPNSKKTRKKKTTQDTKQKGLYQRSKQSIRRSKLNFYRLCHHNNKNAKTIHFLTLTYANDIHPKKAQRYATRFMATLSKNIKTIPIRYISVPELTKKGRIHYHILIYDLPTKIASQERTTRYLQRKFHRGYLDILTATYTSSGIAGYMAKYMAKAIGDNKLETIRGYNCSRNIKKTTSYGANGFHSELSDYLPCGKVDIQETKYKVPFLGTCVHKKIINLQYETTNNKTEV